jgi:hypothetical protein
LDLDFETITDSICEKTNRKVTLLSFLIALLLLLVNPIVIKDPFACFCEDHMSNLIFEHFIVDHF